MPERKQVRKQKIRESDFDHQVGGGRPSRKRRTYETEPTCFDPFGEESEDGGLPYSGVTFPGYTATFAEPGCGEVSPELKVKKEEVTSARTWCRRKKEEVKSSIKCEFGVKRKYPTCEPSSEERWKNSRRRCATKENCPSTNSSQQADDLSVTTELSMDYGCDVIQGHSIDGSMADFEVGACPVESETETEGEPERVCRPRSPGCSLDCSDSSELSD